MTTSTQCKTQAKAMASSNGKLAEGKCDTKCVTGYRLDVAKSGSDDQVNTGTYTCQKCDPHCSVCDTNGKDKCDEKSSTDDYCEQGWVLDRSTKKCVQCDKHCINCKTKGANKCDDVDYCTITLTGEDAEVGFYIKDDTCHKCLAHCAECTGEYQCTTCVTKKYYKVDGATPETSAKPDECKSCLTNCDVCEDGDTCETCSEGYTYNPGKEDKEKNACIKIDCSPVDPNCDLCVGDDRNSLTCIKCKANYEFEDDEVYRTEEEQEPKRFKCIEKAKSIECTMTPEEEGVDTEIYYHRKDKCYTEHHLKDGSTTDYYHKYFKYEQVGGKTVYRYYYDEDCMYKEQKTSEATFATCTTLDNTKKDPNEKVYVLTDGKCEKGTHMYTDNKCTTKKTWASGCYKMDTDKYVKLTTEGVASYGLYHEKDCDDTDALPSKIIYEDDDPKDEDGPYIENGHKYTISCVWPTEPSPEPTPDPVDTSCEVSNCSECSEDKKTCTKCATGYTLKDNTCEKNSDGSNDDGDKCGSVMNIIMLTILIISLMI